MKQLTSLLVLITLLIAGCSTPSWNPHSDRSIASEHLSKFDGKEPIAKGVLELLNEEQNLHNKDLWGANAFASNIAPEYIPENNPKFPLPYYLVPAEDAKFLQADSLDKRVSKQLMMMVDGKKYFKLFVHPESEAHYEFMRDTYKYVSQDETEFTASPTSSYRSLVVWDHSDLKNKPFIAKVSLDKNVIGSIDRLVSENEVERSVANQKVFDRIGLEKLNKMNVKVFPESAGLVMGKELPGAPEKLGGQLIREIPDEVVNSKSKWLSFSALMSPNKKPKPLIMDVIKASGMDSFTFFEEYMIKSYMKMFENLSLKSGMNFEPHSQNLCFETTMDLKPTGKWVVRDFGGVWPDVFTMAKNNGPVDVYMESTNVKKFKLRGGRSNYISSYVFFYKRQVFDMMLSQVALYDETMTQKKMAQLKAMIDTAFIKQINSYLGLNLKTIPNMNDYKVIEELVINETKMPEEMPKKPLSESADLKEFILKKQKNEEWISMAKVKGKTEFFLTDHGVYEVQKGKVVGMAFFNAQEKDEYKKGTGFVLKLSTQIPVKPLNCWGMLKSFF